MKIVNFFLAMAAFSPALASAETYQTLVSCTAEEATTYAIQVSDGEPSGAFIVKTPTGGSPLRIQITQPSATFIAGYGHTYIVTEDFGRSGYAHFYANLASGKALVDINRFLDDASSTDGPLTNLTCNEGQ